jgi:hypothetical protein
MKNLLTVTAVVEAPFGLAMLVWPPLPVTLLLGAPLDTPAGLTIGRIYGASVVTLAVGCWLARYNGQSCAATGLVAGLLLYNTAAVAILASAGIVSALVGVLLWPAVVIHSALAAWCGACLRARPGRE